MRITRTLTTAIAIAALVAPAAQARPADPPDMHASVALAAAEARERQERAPRPLGHAGDANWASAPTVITETADPAPARAHAADERSGGEASRRDSGIRWSTIGLGVLGSLLAVGGLAAVAHRRTQRLRVSV